MEATQNADSGRVMTWREWWQSYAELFGVHLSDQQADAVVQAVADGWWPYPKVSEP